MSAARRCKQLDSCFSAIALLMFLLPCAADAKPLTKNAYNQTLEYRMSNYIDKRIIDKIDWELPNLSDGEFFMNLAPNTGTITKVTIEVRADGTVTGAKITEPFGIGVMTRLLPNVWQNFPRKALDFRPNFRIEYGAKCYFALIWQTEMVQLHYSVKKILKPFPSFSCAKSYFQSGGKLNYQRVVA